MNSIIKCIKYHSYGAELGIIRTKFLQTHCPYGAFKYCNLK
ncbi:hypothetical protein B0I22_0464 [Epilithonimonas xixisoli]|uniref:Uncharacterized protein n=1 Tax=Epilithonimonas xixisoli TaxID=1476462 RepID=A0A4R8ID62_9FLAO|nr:hypothetical protein B0I22_0464 [Epilithonimonas xixisoli]